MNNYILGVDRSHRNTPVSIAELNKQGVKIFAHKAAQWLYGEDSKFNNSWQETKSIPDAYRLAYYFFDPRFDGIAQCKQFLSLNINFKGIGCIGGCVDVEDLEVYNSDGSINQKLTDQANQWVVENWQLALERLNDFLNYFKQQTGLDCWIYSYNSYMKQTYHSHPFPANKMWISSIQPNCPVRYDTGKVPEMWQFTYNWNGSDMDGNYFTGTEQELNKLANITS